MGKKQNNQGQFDDIDIDDDTIDDIDDVDDTDDQPTDGPSKAGGANRESALMQLLADPDIQSIVNARRLGKKVKVVDAVDDDTDEPVDEPSDDDMLDGLAEDDPARKVLETLNKRIDKVLGSRLEKVNDRVGNLEGLAQTIQRQEAKKSVAQARAKFADFDEFRPAMAKLSTVLPGTSIEELYLLAKHRAGKLNLDKPSTSTERPTRQPSRPSKRDKGAVRAKGRAAFNDALTAALEGLDL